MASDKEKELAIKELLEFYAEDDLKRMEDEDGLFYMIEADIIEAIVKTHGGTVKPEDEVVQVDFGGEDDA